MKPSKWERGDGGRGWVEWESRKKEWTINGIIFNTHQALWLPLSELTIALIGILTSPINTLLDPFHRETLLKQNHYFVIDIF